MPRGIITCHSNQVSDILAHLDHYHCRTCSNMQDTLDVQKDDPADFIYFSTQCCAGTSDIHTLLAQVGTTVKVIVQINDDDPKLAFDLLRRGAYYVMPRPFLRSTKLLDVVGKAARTGTRYISEPLLGNDFLCTTKNKRDWGFMSMNWLQSHSDGYDYNFSIAPTFKQLGLQLQRLDEFFVEAKSVRERTEKGIDSRRVVLALISPYRETIANTFGQSTSSITFPPSPNVMYELGIASAKGKQIILLYRDTGVASAADNPAIPAVLRDAPLVEYSTRTELAIKLYFGLGGSVDNIKEWTSFK